MIDHVSIAVADLSRAIAFYESLLAPLGHTKLRESATAAGFGKSYPEFWLYLREGAGPAPEGSGSHVALRAGGVAAVDAFHAAALANGGRCDGPPGFRKIYGPRYYAAFIRDPDANRIEAVTFVEEKG